MPDKFEHYHAALTWFAKNAEIYSCSRMQALEMISRKICEVMKVQRFGVWMFTITRDAIYEEMTYSLDGQISHGKVLSRKDHPLYFKKVDHERVISINHKKEDLELAQFSEIYM